MVMQNRYERYLTYTGQSSLYATDQDLKHMQSQNKYHSSKNTEKQSKDYSAINSVGNIFSNVIDSFLNDIFNIGNGTNNNTGNK